MIHFKCPKCGTRYKKNDSSAGKQATCPTCRQVIVIPPPANHTVLQINQDEALATTLCVQCRTIIGMGEAFCPSCGHKQPACDSSQAAGSSQIPDPRREDAGVGLVHSSGSYYGTALASMVIAIVAFFVFGFLGIVSTVLGAVAISGMKRTGNHEGRGMAVTGLVLGIVDTIGWGIILVYLAKH